MGVLHAEEAQLAGAGRINVSCAELFVTSSFTFLTSSSHLQQPVLRQADLGPSAIVVGEHNSEDMSHLISGLGHAVR